MFVESQKVMLLAKRSFQTKNALLISFSFSMSYIVFHKDIIDYDGLRLSKLGLVRRLQKGVSIIAHI